MGSFVKKKNENTKETQMADALDNIEEKIKADLSWLQRHERLVLAVIAGVALWFAIGKIDTLLVNHDRAATEQAKIVAAVQQEKNDALAVQVAQQAAQYKELTDEVQAQNAQLEQANVALVATLTKQQKVDASLPLPELTNRWLALVPEAKPVATPTGVSLTDAGARATVQQLELIPAQQQELVTAQTELKNDQNLISAADASITTLNLRVDGLGLQLADNAKVCATQLATVKAEARKSKRTWFYIGYGAGLATRAAIGFLTGH